MFWVPSTASLWHNRAGPGPGLGDSLRPTETPTSPGVKLGGRTSKYFYIRNIFSGEKYFQVSHTADDQRNNILFSPARLHSAHQSENKKKPQSTPAPPSEQPSGEKCLDFLREGFILLLSARIDLNEFSKGRQVVKRASRFYRGIEKEPFH